MPKRGIKKVKKTSRITKSSLNKIEKSIKEEIKEVENWVIQRKKFLIKLAWVLILITILLIASNIYLKVSGVGI